MQMKWKRTLALLLAVLLLGSSVPLAAGAEDGYKVGDTVVYGCYPQTRIKVSGMTEALDTQAVNWQSYGYYSGTGESDDGKMTAKSYMQYCDVTYGGQKYRGVKFSSYRPIGTGYTSSINHQQSNHYYTDTTYWFRYEPLRWRVFDPATGLMLCETIIDSQPYNNYMLASGEDEYGYTAYWGDADKTHYANNYSESSLRQWLNDEFYSTAFTKVQQDGILATTLDNSDYSPDCAAYGSASTTDKVFLLSYNDFLNPAYGFEANQTKDFAIQVQGSDYAKCQGLRTYRFNEYSDWWLRSPGVDSDSACGVTEEGWIGPAYSVNSTDVGIRPALRLNMGSEISESAQLRVTVTDLTVQYRSSGKLAPNVAADEGVQYTLAYSGFDSGIISVDENGSVTTRKAGTTTVTVTATDEYGNKAEAKCTVTVKYAWWQMLIRIFLFGWLWY